jgi:hypothetical protein
MGNGLFISFLTSLEFSLFPELITVMLSAARKRLDGGLVLWHGNAADPPVPVTGQIGEKK